MRVQFLRAARGVAQWLGSKLAWRIVVGLLLVQALWFVFSAQYPMAFDENYHFGLIKLHAQQILPFFTAQPHNAAVYGAVVRDPSYLYHWLMSFPYRLVSLITSNETAQIIFLRLINVGLFVGAVLLYRRIVRRLGLSDALSTSLFAIFVLIPVVPFLAAHINYDNLFFLAVPLTVLLVFDLVQGFERGSIEVQTLLLLLATLFLSCLIKYPFLPVFVISVVFVAWRAWRSGLISKKGLWLFTRGFMQLKRLRRIFLALLVVLAVGLFAERYMANVVSYHNPIPACDAVISQDECEQYGPYGRDHVYAQEKSDTFHANIFVYAWEWLYGMWYRLFFAISYDYSTAPPLYVLAWFAVGMAALLGVAVVVRARTLFAGKPLRQFVLLLLLGYGLALFADGFSAYKKTGQPVAINGRYLIPFLPFLFAFGGLAWSQLLRSRTALKAAAASLVIAVFVLQGGGATTFLIRSNDAWMWNNDAVRSVNRTLRSAAWPFILGKGSY